MCEENELRDEENETREICCDDIDMRVAMWTLDDIVNRLEARDYDLVYVIRRLKECSVLMHTVLDNRDISEQ